MHQCFRNKIQIQLNGNDANLKISDIMHIDSLHYTDQLYTFYWNIKLNKHSLYYLTITAIDRYGTSTSDVTEISKNYMYINVIVIHLDTYNVKDLIIERKENTVCFKCVTILLNECQISIASSTETVTPQIQILYNNGTCYSFTDNGTYTVYVHDTEDGMTILTPAIVKEYTVDWIISSSKGKQLIVSMHNNSH